MATKRSRKKRPPSSSSEEEAPQATWIDRCPVLIGKNVDLASFTFDVPSFHIEDLFVSMGRVSILTLNDNVYLSIVKDFYKKMTFSSGTVSFHDSVTLPPKATDTINTTTLKCMKIIEKDEQWVAQSKGFDDELGPSTLSFEGGEEMDEAEDEDEPLPKPRSQRPSSSTSYFTEHHFNLLNGRIDSLTSSIEGLHHAAEDLRHTIGTLQQSMDGMTSLLQALHSCLDAMILPPPPPES
ncbi:hypothetical protein Adt_03832 [Abeliophyllum distichum]|uniref:Uncharacterized protein n=1 Tax=Abeliophyllum distichum TaxID=126358 RepID=A0ABD1VZN9_9LAMI